MTNAIRRKVSIDPVLAEVRDLQTKFDLGTSLGAIFEEPMETGLLVNELKLYSRRLNIPGRAEAAARESKRQEELYEMRNELDQTYDENKIASIRKQMQQLKDQGSYLDAFYQEQAELGNLETPEALNEQYADLGLTFDRPMSKEEAQLRADIKREQIVRNAVISLGPQGAGVTALQIGTGLTKAIIDPIGIASAFVPVVGQDWCKNMARLEVVQSRVQLKVVLARSCLSLSCMDYLRINSLTIHMLTLCSMSVLVSFWGLVSGLSLVDYQELCLRTWRQ